MSYRIDITGKDSYILIELFGEIGIQKILALDSFLYADTDFINHPYVIWDFTECTIDIVLDLIIEFSNLLRKSRNSQTPGKTAFVTHHTNNEIAEASEDEIELIDENPCQIKGFPTRVNAVQWILER